MAGFSLHPGRTFDISDLREKIEENPRSGNLRIELALAYAAKGQYRNATETWIGSVNAGFAHPEILNNCAIALLDEGRTGEAIALLRAALKAHPSHTEIRSNLLLALNSCPDIAPDQVAAEHFRFAECCPSTAAAVPARHAGATIRLGYVSGSFRRHAAMRFFEPVLFRHDRRRFEVLGFTNSSWCDTTTERLKASFNSWHDISDLDDAEAAALIRRERIDILVDLDGHTANNRVPLFALKPAPIQVSWLGYANTTGLQAIDYRITDSIADPPGCTERFHSEKLLRLDPVFLGFTPPDAAPDVGELPALRNNRVTFACFNQLHKLSGPTVRAMAMVLASVPQSSLLLKSLALCDPAVCRDLRARFQAFSISPERVICHGFLPDARDHLNLYNSADIALDSFPYNGTTTTCDALWMGLPVVTLEGATHAARVGASIMKNAGMPEIIAQNESEYIAAAAALARDLPRLALLRRKMRATLSASPLCDVPAFVARLESAFCDLTLNFLAAS